MSEPKHIRFVAFLNRPGGYSCWEVENKHSGDRIGIIRWYLSWRQFCFDPGSRCIFSADCLRDIADFCETETKKAKLDSVAETVRRGYAT